MIKDKNHKQIKRPCNCKKKRVLKEEKQQEEKQQEEKKLIKFL